jgi:hypothetical protein
MRCGIYDVSGGDGADDGRSIMDHIELGRRLVACKHFRPMRGMRDVQGRSWDDSLLWRWNSAIDVPDLRDPATVGCLLALVRESCGDHEAYAMPWNDEDGGWTVCLNDDDGCHNIAEGDTEAEALVAALEAAP